MQGHTNKTNINSNFPRRVIPGTRKLFWNDFTRGSIITVRRTTIIMAIVFFALLANGFTHISRKAFADSGSGGVTFSVEVPTDSLIEVKLFNPDGTNMGNTASMDVVPSMFKAGFNEKEVVVSVGTNNAWGYNLMMNIDNTSLVSNSDSNNTIPSLAKRDAAYTCTPETADTCDFTLNSWGFQIKEDTNSQSATNGYIAIPNSIKLNENTTITNGDPTHILFGSKVNASQAAGAYSTTINFVATANPAPPPFNGITTMQEMTPQNCAAANENDTVQLEDTRDNTTYTVAKLADGNCWMTQNLALGSKSLGEITLTSADSDVSSNFTLPVPTTISFSSSNYDVANYRNYTSNSTNYYNWYTATAGTGNQSTAAYTAATSSICPKGWRLPNGSIAAGVAGEWAELFYAAGITSSLATGTSSVSYTADGAAKRAAAPYNIPNTYGYFNTTGTAPTSTSYTYFWANRTYSSTSYAWSTYIGSSSATLNYGSGYKYQGIPMRCVAHKAETKPTITYNVNGGTGSIVSQTAASTSEFPQSFTLSDGTGMTRTNHVLAGWSTDPNATPTTMEYDSGQTVVTTSNLNLYAVWYDVSNLTTFDSAFASAGKSKDTTTNLYKMQDMSSTICGNVTNTEIAAYAVSTQLVDTRDNKIYWVSKLKDGNCWMLDNLTLDLTDSTVLNNLTYANTNASAASLTSLKSGNRSTGNRYATAGVSNWTSSYSYSAPLVNMNSWDVTPSDSLSSAAGNQWKIGGCYNYCAASAGSYCYGNDTSYGTSSGNATEDICPAGWRMPTGNTSGEYQALYDEYKDYTNFRNALHLPLSGYFHNGSVNYQGSYGFFWSSTRNDNNYMYYLYAKTSSITPADVHYRRMGLSVRCVAGS